MEKEMKKLLLVAVSVGVFLLITITVAIVILTPKAQTQEIAFSPSVPLSNVRDVPDIMPAVISAPDPITDEIDIDGNRNIQIPIPSTAAVPENIEIPEAQIARQPTATTQTPAVTQTQTPQAPAARTPAPAPRSTTTAARPATTTTTTNSNTASARPSASRAVNDYWIQIGAYSSMVGAEDVRERLSSKGLVSIIENREINGRNLYRVRLGPYTSEREANHWLEIVKTISGLQDSQIRQTIR
jgi:DedD protein